MKVNYSTYRTSRQRWNWSLIIAVVINMILWGGLGYLWYRAQV